MITPPGQEGLLSAMQGTIGTHMRLKFRQLSGVLCLTCLVVAACSNSKEKDSPRPSVSTPATSNSNAALNKDDYPVFPDPDSGADPSIPAEQGGKGFTGQGWETNTTFD